MRRFDNTLITRCSIVGCLGLLMTPSCGPKALPTPGGQAALASDPEQRISVTSADNRPALVLVRRQGDPVTGIAVAVWVAENPQAAQTLASWNQHTLRARGLEATATPNRYGYLLRASVPQRPGQTEAAMNAMAAVLRAPLSGEALGLVDEELPAVSRVARCSGRHGAIDKNETMRLGYAELERARQQSAGAETVVFAVVGEESALREAHNWRNSDSPWLHTELVVPTWPSSPDVVVQEVDASGESSVLDVGLWIPDPAVATVLAERALDPGSELRMRVEASRTWSLLSAGASVGPEGGCLHAQLEANDNVQGNALVQSASHLLARLQVDAQNAQDEPAPGDTASRQVLRATDPRTAASVAAWWALARRRPGVTTQLSASLQLAEQSASSPIGTDAEQTKLLLNELTRSSQRAVRVNREVVIRTESGQGRLWLMVASPCAVHGESVRDSGVSALAATAATRLNREQGVHLEPWVTVDGVGLLASASYLPGESPSALARRVGGAMGQALGLPLSERAIDAARIGLASLTFPASPRAPTLEALAAALSPSNPSLIGPFGMASVRTELDPTTVNLRWSAFAAGPLRIAVLANHDKAQGELAALSVDQWLPQDRAARVCPDGTPSPTLPTQPVLLNAELGTARTVLVRPIPRTSPVVLQQLLDTLNAPEGPLRKSLRKAMIPGALHASRVRLGTHVFVTIEVTSAPEVHAAVEEMLTRQISQLATTASLSKPLRFADNETEGLALEPRRRLVRTWLREEASPPSDLPGEWTRLLSGFAQAPGMVLRFRPSTD